MGTGVFDSNDAASPAVIARGTNGAHGIDATSDIDIAVFASTGTGVAVEALSNKVAVRAAGGDAGVFASGVTGVSASGGVTGVSASGNVTGVAAESPNSTAMQARSGGSNFHTSIAIGRTADEGRIGVAAAAGQFANDAVAGDIILRTETPSQHLLLGLGPNNSSIAISNEDVAVKVTGKPGSGQTGVLATSDTGIGVSGQQGPLGSAAAAGVFGSSPALNSNGVIGEANNGAVAFGVWGRSNSGFAGFFNGNVSIARSFDGTKQGDLNVTGTLTKGMGGFRIDHPLDPENKYLSHSFVESPDMLNVYNGNVTTDANGDAAVTLPDYFEALNQDFRYQLTVIGQFAQAIVAGEISNNQFTIKTDKPNIKVSWQVTGVRKDPFAEMHRLLAEEDKRANERGMYLHPEAYGKPETQSIEHALGKVLKGP